MYNSYILKGGGVWFMPGNAYNYSKKIFIHNERHDFLWLLFGTLKIGDMFLN